MRNLELTPRARQLLQRREERRIERAMDILRQISPAVSRGDDGSIGSFEGSSRRQRKLLETSGTKSYEVTGESSDLLIQYSGWPARTERQ